MKIAACLLLAALLVVKIVTRRGLYADAPNFLIDMLGGHGFVFGDSHRMVAHFLYQFPVALALLAGVRDMGALAFVFAGWVVALPALLWGFALWQARRGLLFWGFLLLFSIVNLNTDFFAIGEYNLTSALAACCLALLVGRSRLTPVLQGLLAGFGAAMILTYPSTVFLCPALGWVGWQADRRGRLSNRPARLIFAASLAFATATGLWEILTPRDPAAMESARDMSVLLYDRQYWLCLLTATCAMLGLFATQRIVAFSLATVALLAGLLVALPAGHAIPSLHYLIRSYTGLALALGIGLTGWWRFYGARYAFTLERCRIFNPLFYIVPVLGLFAALSMADIKDSLRWDSYLSDYTALLDSHHGLMRYESTMGEVQDQAYFFYPWTNPVLSLVLRNNARSGLMLNPAAYPGWQPFDPRVAVPDMSHYYENGK